MDQKHREGDPFSGKPMKRFGEGDPAPIQAPDIDISEVIKPLAEAKVEEKFPGMVCPCGRSYNECVGFLGSDKDWTFENMGVPKDA